MGNSAMMTIRNRHVSSTIGLVDTIDSDLLIDVGRFIPEHDFGSNLRE